MTTWLLRHLQVLFDTLGRLSRAPLSTFLTFIVIGIAFALPLFLLQIAQSAEEVSNAWQGRPQLTLVLSLDGDPSVQDEVAYALGEKILEDNRIDRVNYISPFEAMVEFKRTSGIGDILDTLPGQTLPPVLVIFPHLELPPRDLEDLVREIEPWPEIAEVHYDIQWLQRLNGILQLIRSLGIILSALMIAGVLLIISHSIRLGIAARQDEIEIIDQIGGEHYFIRRPFLYYGLLLGLGGGLCAWVLTNIALYFLNQPLANLASLYGTELSIPYLNGALGLALIGVSMLLGWLAARITVGAHLKKLRIF